MDTDSSSKLPALLLSVLMATISISVSIPSWDFSILETKDTKQSVVSNSTVNVTVGHATMIETTLSGNSTLGNYSVNPGVDGMFFTAENISALGKVAIGFRAMCVILDDGNVKCWGSNSYGQSGLPTGVTYISEPNAIDFGPDRFATSITAGNYHVCAILDEGSVVCWGQGNYGQLGNNLTSDEYLPQKVDLGQGRTAVSIDSGSSHTCAILDDGSLKCWGTNFYGQLGIGTNTNHNTPQSVNLGSGRTAVSVSAGMSHTCVILDNGNLKCWGYNSRGQLGIGSTTTQTTPQPVSLGTGRTANMVSAGGYHTCAILDDGSLKCWGYNLYGQLGIGISGSSAGKTTPQTVNLGSGRTADFIDSGNDNTCTITDDNVIKCWGRNYNGMLGLGTSYSSTVTTPANVSVDSDSYPVSITSTFYYYGIKCVTLEDRTIQCWGYDNQDILGWAAPSRIYNSREIGTYVNRTVTEITAGSFHNCIIDNMGELKCWGKGTSGQLGIGNSINIDIPAKVDLGAGRTATYVSAGNFHNCAILDNGSLKCWGQNSNGQLGVGSTTNQNTPQYVDLGTGRTAISVSLGSYHTCAILDNGSLKCWGNNYYGQLGIGSTTSQTTPQYVDLGTGRTAISVSLGSSHTCAILDDGSLKCWGLGNSGQLGLGTSTNHNTPQLVNLGTGRTAVSISLGGSHTCAILDNGSLKCWGLGNYGQLGLGTNANHNTPQYVDLGTGRTAISVSLGSTHTCAILDDGSVKCWGYNNKGQLGIGNTATQTSPQSVILGYGISAESMALGSQHTCVKFDDKMKCWGTNEFGVLGIDTYSGYIATPTEFVNVFETYPHSVLGVDESNSWFGSIDNIGVYNLDVWYNTSTTNTLHRTVVNASPTISYSSYNHALEVNKSAVISPISFNCNSCDFEISPQLPIGMKFNITSGVINGTPTSVVANRSYSIKTTNLSGVSTLDLWIEITDKIPEITSTTTSLSFIRGFKNQTNDLTNIGGALTSSELYPPIDGLSTMNLPQNENLVLNSFASCAILSSGLECWGDNFDDANLLYERYIVKDISLSHTNTCILRYDGIVECIGDNDNGEIDGTNNQTSFSNFTEAKFRTTNIAMQIAVTDDQICILDTANDIYCNGQINYTIINDDFGPIKEFDSGEKHFCIVNELKSLFCWGDNLHGAIGNGQSQYSVIPQRIGSANNLEVIDFDAGQKHTCAVRNDTKIMCWGTGTSGQIGDGYSITHQTPQLVDSPAWASFTKVSAGNSHTCGMTNDSVIMCWGNNSNGQIGDGTTTNRLSPVNVSIIPSWMNVVDVVAGDEGTCVVDSTGFIWCWGNNTNQKLMLNSTINTATSPHLIRFTKSSALSGVLDMGVISGAPQVSQTATVHRLYGNNSGGSDDVNITILVDVAATYSTTQFNLTRNTSVVNTSPSILGGPYSFSVVPDLPAGLHLGANNGTIWGMPTEIHPLTNHTIFVDNNNGYDQIGFTIQVHDIPPDIEYPSNSYTLVRNWSIDVITPSHKDGEIDMIGISPNLPAGVGFRTGGFFPTSVSAGSFHSCGIDYLGSLKCWGDNGYGQLGIGSITDQYTPQTVDVGGKRTPVNVSAGNYHTCAILDDRSLKCWGYNSMGQLGLGNTTSQYTPQDVYFGQGKYATDIDLGNSYTCAILDDGSLKCWGLNSQGQLGLGDTATQYIPKSVNLGQGRNATSISTGDGHTCAILDDGSLKCWGINNYGQLGINSSLPQYSPVNVDIGVGRTAISISAGGDHTCAVLDDGSVKCWGRNLYGQLGINSTTDYSTPQLVNLGPNKTAVSIDAGEDHTCAIINDGSIKCWGRNYNGQIGNGDMGYSKKETTPVPIIVDDKLDAVSISVGFRISFAVFNDGSMKSWGYNIYGQLGINSTTHQDTPQDIDSMQSILKFEGEMFGIPTTTTPGVNYTIVVNNSYGSNNETIYLEVVPAYDYGNETLVLTRNQTMTRSPIITGGPYNVSISPALPQGLNFDPTNGTVWGTPSNDQSIQSYFINVSNSSGEDTIVITITVGEIAPIVAYDTSNETLVRGFNITRINHTQTGGHVGNVESDPALPQGLEFLSQTDGAINGTPTSTSPWTDYTIWTNNSFGSYSNIISLRVVPAYDYGNNSLSLVRNETMSTRSPIITGGPYSSVSISPTLPVGLFFEPSNGSIWGTPIFNQPATQYTITSSNQYGQDSTTISIGIAEIPPILEYDLSEISYRRGFAKTHPLPILTGGAVAGFEISPALPTGISMDSLTGIFSGVPSETHNATTHTIWANNSFGSSNWTINIEVLPGIYNPNATVDLIRNVTMSPYVSVINIVERNLSISPDLPLGLTFDYNSATISGTSLIPISPRDYHIRLWNSSGEDWLNITITVEEIAPNVYYNTTNSTAYIGFGFEPFSPIGDAGYPEVWDWNGSSTPGIYLSKYNSSKVISSSGSNTCSITADYRLVCWGANDMGQLGQGNTGSISGLVNITLSSLEEPVDVAVGEHHTCIVTSQGKIECWGQNDFGQLGRDFKCAYGSYERGCNGNFAVTLPGIVNYSGHFGFTQVSVGDTHTCGLLANGKVMCWGANSDGQLGDGTTIDSYIPVHINSATGMVFTNIDVGKAHSCATNDMGELYCWGRNSFGQLGDGTINNKQSPNLVNLPIGYQAESVSSGSEHTCAILNGSKLACWGRNAVGQLGDGTLLGKLEPRLISVGSGVASVTAGSEQTCAITVDDQVWCWGQSRTGMFSSGNTVYTSPVIVLNEYDIGAYRVVIGEQHLCISTNRWSVMCTGDNQANQIPWINSTLSHELVEYGGNPSMMLHVHDAFAGTLYGTPESGIGSVSIEIRATNSIGVDYIQHTIVVDDSYSYPLTFVEGIRNQPLSPVTPISSGLYNATFTIEPVLPLGLNFNIMTGEISGTPAENNTLTTYTITYSNDYGAVSNQLQLIVYEPAADITYPVSDIVLTRSEGTVEYTPTVSNGVVEEWSIHPPLPDGLSFVDGVISGQASNNQTLTIYRIYGNNTGGVSFVDLNITVLEPAPVFIPLQSQYFVERGQVLANIAVSNIGGYVSSWTITPELPEGLEFNDGTISGTPTVNMSVMIFTIRGENSGGYYEVNFSITVLEPAPLISSDLDSITATRNQTIDRFVIDNSGGMASNWTIIPELPEGIYFEDGIITGTPIVNSTSELFIVTAISEGGLSQFSFTLEVLEPLPIFSIDSSDYLFNKDVPFDSIKLNSIGGEIESFSINPSLPSGMFFDERRGIIQGVPLVVSPSIEYTITAQNSGGSYSDQITIEILNQAPVFTLPYESISLTEKVEMDKFAPFISTDFVVDSWSLEFEENEGLPIGLVFDSTTGSIIGRPTKVSSFTEITLTASNDGGSYSLMFTLRVLPDFDGDTIPDELDDDDDNDGYSDKEEENKDSDPYDETSVPVEGFEIIIPNTEISLGAWDLIGISTGIPLIIFLTFSLLTRNKRTARFKDRLENASTREEISEVAEGYERALMFRLIGPHQGMRLERIRAEADDMLEENERRFRYKLEDEEEKEIPEITEEKAQFYDQIDQTPLVEQATGMVDEEETVSERSIPIDTKETMIDDEGRRWYIEDDGTHWWRSHEEQEWTLLESEESEKENTESD